mgnify:CR=1 FL=1
MANYTFTPSTCYALSTHDVTFTSTNIIIKLTSTGLKVLDQAYGTGVAFMCQNGDLCVGTLTANKTFKNQIDFKNPKAYIKLEEKAGANYIIGSNQEDDNGIYKYNNNLCPVRLSENGGVVTIDCPCESDSGKCTHKCYEEIKG